MKPAADTLLRRQPIVLSLPIKPVGEVPLTGSQSFVVDE